MLKPNKIWTNETNLEFHGISFDTNKCVAVRVEHHIDIRHIMAVICDNLQYDHSKEEVIVSPSSGANPLTRQYVEEHLRIKLREDGRDWFSVVIEYGEDDATAKIYQLKEVKQEAAKIAKRLFPEFAGAQALEFILK